MNTYPSQRPPQTTQQQRACFLDGRPSSLSRSMASVAALAFCSAAAPSHVRCLGTTGALGTSHWAAAFPTNSRAATFPNSSSGSSSSLRSFEYVNDKHGDRSRRRPPLSLTRTGPWSAPPPRPASALRGTARHREEQLQQQPLPSSSSSSLLAVARTLLRRVRQARAPPPRTPSPAAAAAAERPPAQVKHAGLVLVPWLWRPFQQPVVAKSAGGAAAAGSVLEVGATSAMSATTRATKPALTFVQVSTCPPEDPRLFASLHVTVISVYAQQLFLGVSMYAYRR